MITIFNSKSIYLGSDMNKFSNIRNTLEQQNIKYKYKVTNKSGQWTGRGVTRSIGGNLQKNIYEYEILIYKKDYEKASQYI